MGIIDEAQRNKLPTSDFAEPSKRAFPVENRGHAIAAKSDASKMVNKGKMSKSTEAKIDAKANKKLKGNSGGIHGFNM